MAVSDVQWSAIRDRIAELGPSFTTKDVSGDPTVMSRHGSFAAHSHYHAMVGRFLSSNMGSLGIRKAAKSPSGGQRWEKRDAAAVKPLTESTTPAEPIRPGHRLSLGYFKSIEMAHITMAFDRYELIGGTYFRLTDKGIQPVDLSPASSKPLLGIGGPITPGRAAEEVEIELPRRVAELQRKRAVAGRSEEKQLEAALTRDALRNHLVLARVGPTLRFLANQWRLAQLGTLDLLAVDQAKGDLVVIELKIGPEDHASAVAQVGQYVEYVAKHWSAVAPFFSELMLAMAERYDAPDMTALTLTGTVRGLVVRRTSTGSLEVHDVIQVAADVSPPSEVPPVLVLEDSVGRERNRANQTSTLAGYGLGPQYSGDDELTSRMRFHQSWWRAEMLGVPFGTGPRVTSTERFGNMLDAESATNGLNFLTEQVADVARQRIALGGGVEPFRCTRNLLSSQPMCFNLFAPLLAMAPSLATACVAALLEDETDCIEVEAVHFEVAPTPQGDYLDDRTAFDAFIEYRRADETLGFIAIETKLTEPFSQKVVRPEKYLNYSGLFPSVWHADAPARLVDVRWFQLWRNHLLAKRLAARPEQGYTSSLVVVAHHPHDRSCSAAVEGYRSLVVEPDSEVVARSLEQIADRWQPLVDGTASEPWLQDFRTRYLELERSETAWADGHRAQGR
jgi:hypothetical protein